MKRRGFLLSLLVVVVLGAITGGILATNGRAAIDSDGKVGDNSATTRPNGDDADGSDGQEPVSGPALAEEQEPVAVTELPEASVGESVDFGSRLVATITSVEQVDVEALAPGETSGPGVAVHLELRNDSSEPVDLALVSINVTKTDGVPAIPNGSPPAEELSGVLDSGEARTGVYVFRIDGPVAGLLIDVSHASSPNIVVVRT